MRTSSVMAVTAIAVLTGLWVLESAEGAWRRNARLRRPYRRTFNYRTGGTSFRGSGGYRHATRAVYLRTPNRYGSIRQNRQIAVREAAKTATSRRESTQAAAAAVAADKAAERLTELPPTHARLNYDGKSYYLAVGRYYMPTYSEGSVVYDAVEPPPGLVVESIPSDALSVTADGKTYYYANGVYYTDTRKNDRLAYVVTEAPGADAVSAIASVEPDAFDILKQMSDFPGTVQSYSVKGFATVESVLDSGQKVHFSSTKTVDVRRPNKIYVETRGDILSRNTWYDGAQITMLDLDRNVYAQVDTPPTIDEALDFVAREYGVTLPLADLFYSDVYESVAPDLESGVYLGLHKVGSVDCHHLALEGEAADVEVWIEAGNEPLIRKISIVHKQVEDAPNFVAMLDWDIKAVFTDDEFTFTAPEGAEKIDMAPLESDEQLQEGGAADEPVF